MKQLIKKVLAKIKTIFSQSHNTELVEEVSYQQKREIIDGYRNKFALQTLVETGTFLGDTIFYFINKFEQLYSIELSDELAERAQVRFKDDKNVTILKGDSANLLNRVIQTLNENALFWLDGHYSSEFFYNGEYMVTAKSDKNTPIMQELDILLTSPYRNVILIDDARLFVGENDYPTIDSIKEKVMAAGKNYVVHVDTDIIHIIPN